jgi:hypothetical protein
MADGMPNLNNINRVAPPLGKEWKDRPVFPRYATIPHWCELSGLGRSRTYELISQGFLRAIKVGARTLIDVEAGLAWLDTLPSANISITQKAGL